MIHLVKNPLAAAAVFFLVLVSYDWILLRRDLLCVYIFNAEIYARGPAKVLLLFSAPRWAYMSLVVLLVHRFGNDTLFFMAWTTCISA